MVEKIINIGESVCSPIHFSFLDALFSFYVERICSFVFLYTKAIVDLSHFILSLFLILAFLMTYISWIMPDERIIFSSLLLFF